MAVVDYDPMTPQEVANLLERLAAQGARDRVAQITREIAAFAALRLALHRELRGLRQVPEARAAHEVARAQWLQARVRQLSLKLEELRREQRRLQPIGGARE